MHVHRVCVCVCLSVCVCMSHFVCLATTMHSDNDISGVVMVKLLLLLYCHGNLVTWLPYQHNNNGKRVSW